MPAGPELRDFNANLTQTDRNIREVRGVIADIKGKIDTVQLAIDAVDRIEQLADRFGDLLGQMKLSLKLMDKTGPLKFVAKIGLQIVDSVQKVALNIEKKAEQLAKKIDDTGIEERLDRAEDKLDSADDKLEGAQNGIAKVLSTTAKVPGALQTMEDFQLGDAGAQLSQTIEQLALPLNDILLPINGAYATIKDAAQDVRDALPGAAFVAVTSVRIAFDRIAASLDFLRGPLNEVAKVLRPVEGLLDAAAFLFNLTVGPIIDWVLETLGIDRIIESVEAKITALLPNPAALDAALGAFDKAFAELDPLAAAADHLGITPWVEDIQQDLLGNNLGNALLGPLGIGTAVAETLQGSALPNLLDGAAGNDTLLGGGGDDVLIAGLGNDVLDGQAGNDVALFSGSLDQYRFSQTVAGGDIVFTHQRPAIAALSDGIDTTRNIETFAFAELSLTRAELLSNVITAGTGQTSLSGSEARDFLYGANVAITIDSRGGNDVLRGSPLADTLRGGDGDDLIVHSAGNDRIEGGSGSDSWRFPLDNASGNPHLDIDLVRGTLLLAGTTTTLVSVENVVVEDSRTLYFFGDAQSNRVQADAARDLIDGRAGDDRLDGGDGDDMLIGGAGVDTLVGGGGSDVLAVGQKAVAGQGEHFDGGDGNDTLTYAADLNPFFPSGHFDRQFTDRARFQEASGPLNVDAGSGRIERLSDDGSTVIAIDTAVNIERFVGSDANDQMRGAGDREVLLDGGPGSDVLRGGHGGGALLGGIGDDVIYASIGGTSADGGSGFDILDLTQDAAVRWLVRLNDALGSRLQAFNAIDGNGLAVPGGSLQNESGPSVLGAGSVANFDLYRSGAEDDYFELRTTQLVEVRAAGGDDFVFGEQPSDGSSNGYRLFGEAGDDQLVLRVKGHLDGGAGEDRLQLEAQLGSAVTAAGGDGDDLIVLRSGSVTIDGGAGRDLLSANNPSPLGGFDIDLAAGTIGTFGSTPRFTGTVTGIEEVIGSDLHNDNLRGSAAPERFIGGGQGDLLEGRGGADALYGGGGNDTLRGGDGDDLLHGGDGNDTLDGGAGIDTASWAFAAPGGAGGALEVAALGSVVADLASGVATTTLFAGGLQSDLLAGIENLVGGAGNDTLRGNASANLLAGGEGADTLDGRAGNDVLILDGNDTAIGGDGDDRFAIGLGSVRVDGGAGLDTLDFGTLRGTVQIDLAAQTYQAMLEADRPVWRDNGGSEARLTGSVLLTPQLVLEADPVFANSSDDAQRNVPAEARFEIDFGTVMTAASGSFTSIENFVAGSADLLLFASQPALSVEGSAAARDVIDFSRVTAAIDYRAGTDIDAVIGSTRADHLGAADTGTTLDGAGGNDRLDSGPGADRLIGGAGLDSAGFAGLRAGHGVTANAAGGFDVRQPDAVVDTLEGIERLVFSDGSLALDLDAAAGEVAKLLGAVFGRDAVLNERYVGIGLAAKDAGASYLDLAALALQESGARSHAEVVAQLWTNVVGSAPSAAEAQPYVDQLAAGLPAAELALFAADTALNATNIDLIGLAQNGLAYS